MWGDYSRCKNLSKKCTLWHRKGPKMALFGHNKPQTPQMAGKSGSQWNTCRRTTLGAKLVRKTHPVVRKWPQMAYFGPKTPFLGHKRPQALQVAGKSGSNGGSQRKTCGGTTLEFIFNLKNDMEMAKMANLGQECHFWP